MWKHYHLLLVLIQINAILSEKSSQPKNAVKEAEGLLSGKKVQAVLHSGEHILKRQTGSFGFQHNSLPTTGGNHHYPYSQSPYSNSGGSTAGRYDPVRGNGLLLAPSLNSLRGDRDRDRDYYYPPSSSSYPNSVGRSGSVGGVGGGASFYNSYRDDYSRDRIGDYRGDSRDRQPYYDDYRYNGYARDREAAAAQNMEFVMRNGQQRHAEYQKRIGHSGQESYDPFYFIGLRNKQQQDGQLPPLSPNHNSVGNNGLLLGSSSPSFPPPPSPSLSSSSSQGKNALLSPSSTSSNGPNGPNSQQLLPSSPSAPASHPLRNRRNSHSQQRRQHLFDNELSGDKYELMSSKSIYPSSSHRNNNNDHPHNNRWAANGGNHHRHHDLDQQFLTREQLVRQHPDSRVNYPPSHNRIDRYGPTIASSSGQPYQVRIGTQLKVNDDGRSPTPHRFYVRDEIYSGRNRPGGRYPQGPIYRRK